MDFISEIYNELFKKIKCDDINIFLCGGASTKEYTSIRDELRKQLTIKKENYHIYYPEDLIINLLNKKNNDLLSLEKFLADNADLIVIVCESPGSFVELGAFTNSLDTRDKIIAILKKKHKYDKSFINLGPVRYLKKNDENSVIYFNSIEDLVPTLKKSVFHKKGFKYRRNLKGIDTIEGLRTFILVILYFCKEYNISELPKDLKIVISKYTNETVFDKLYKTSLKDLYHDKMISKVNDKKVYVLTEKGNMYVYNLLNIEGDLQNAKKCDKIRLRILANQFYPLPIE